MRGRPCSRIARMPFEFPCYWIKFQELRLHFLEGTLVVLIISSYLRPAETNMH